MEPFTSRDFWTKPLSSLLPEGQYFSSPLPIPHLPPSLIRSPRTPPTHQHATSKAHTHQTYTAGLEGHNISGRFKLLCQIGQGAYGTVYLALDIHSVPQNFTLGERELQLVKTGKWRGAGDFYAVKCLSKTGLDGRQRAFQRREIALHSLASYEEHPHLLPLHSVHENPMTLFVVLGFCPNGDLFNMITEKSFYLGKDDLISDVFDQILAAVEHCHELGISHRDLKPENILCEDGGKKVRLADFGLATLEHASEDFGCGSTFYMSPECQGVNLSTRNKSYDPKKNDVWSLGVILVNMTCGRNPWKSATLTDETFKAYLRNFDFLRDILPLSRDANEILKRVFALEPSNRPTVTELRHLCARVKRWNMSDRELALATTPTREAAKAIQAARIRYAQFQALCSPLPTIPPLPHKYTPPTIPALSPKYTPPPSSPSAYLTALPSPASQLFPPLSPPFAESSRSRGSSVSSTATSSGRDSWTGLPPTPKDRKFWPIGLGMKKRSFLEFDGRRASRAGGH
ncbi:kinase-like protein [Atractiella rhizophila]|nr:kinase-like protein [Atractiella rhizophila]